MPDKSILVIDDYHLIDSKPVHDIINFLIEYLPPTIHLVIIGRTDPPLPISRLRVQGEMNEVRTSQLRFTKQEVAAFLNDRMGFDLSSDGIAALEARRQADAFYEIERGYTRSPTTAATLRYAIARVTPNHPGSRATEGKRLLETLLATPERLTPEERTLAAVLLHETNARLKLEAENRRLLATLDERNRSQANSEKHVQVQLEENARLRRALAEAQQKLDAIKEIERSIIERSPTPPGSRDTASETQSPSTSR